MCIQLDIFKNRLHKHWIIKMFYMFGMLKFQVLEAEVIYLVKFFYDITYFSLIFEMWA